MAIMNKLHSLTLKLLISVLLFAGNRWQRQMACGLCSLLFVINTQLLLWSLALAGPTAASRSSISRNRSAPAKLPVGCCNCSATAPHPAVSPNQQLATHLARATIVVYESHVAYAAHDIHMYHATQRMLHGRRDPVNSATSAFCVVLFRRGADFIGC